MRETQARRIPGASARIAAERPLILLCAEANDGLEPEESAWG